LDKSVPATVTCALAFNRQATEIGLQISLHVRPLLHPSRCRSSLHDVCHFCYHAYHAVIETTCDSASLTSLLLRQICIHVKGCRVYRGL